MIRTALLTLSLSLLGACASAPLPAPQLYLLSAQLNATSPAALPYGVGIGPLKWPEYLKRRALITRIDAGRVELSETERWAEPLELNFERVLGENLLRHTQPIRLQTHPWALNDAPDVFIPIEVQQFDRSDQGEVVLRARWRIVGRDKKELLSERSSEIRVPAKDRSPSAGVAAQSEALGRLSDEIGQALSRVAK